MRVTHYGRFWNPELVDSWTKKGMKGLYSPKDNEPKPYGDKRGLYVLHDNYRVIYVGVCGKGQNQTLGERLRWHFVQGNMAGRWDAFSWFAIDSEAGESRETMLSDALRTIEALVIMIAQPPMNSAQPSFPDAAKEIIQYVDEDTKVLLEMNSIEERKLLREIHENLYPPKGQVQSRRLSKSERKPNKT